MTLQEVIQAVNNIKPNAFSNETKTTWINEVEGLVQTEVFLLNIVDVMQYKYSDTVTASGITFPTSSTMHFLSAPGFAVGSKIKISGLTTYSQNNTGNNYIKIVGVSSDRLTYTFATGTFAETGDEEDSATLTYDGSTTELLVIPPHSKIYWTYLSAMIDFANNEYDKYNNTLTVFNQYFGEYMRWYADNYRPADGGCIRQGYYLSAYAIAVKHGYEGTEEEWLLDLKGDKGDKGDTGNGIADTVLNEDYTLTITYTDGTSYTTPSIRGAKGDTGATGNGIASITQNSDYTLTITMTNGQSVTTDPVRGATGNGIASVTKTGTSGNVDTYTITFTDGNTTTFTVTNGTTSVYVNGAVQARIDFTSDPQTQINAKADNTATQTALNAKADKVASAVADNLASLDASGNLKDSGIPTAMERTATNDPDNAVFSATLDKAGENVLVESTVIKGRTVAQNQLVKAYNSPFSAAGLTVTFDSTTGVYSLSGTATTTYGYIANNITAINGHSYYIAVRQIANPNSLVFNAGLANVGGANVAIGAEKIISVSANTPSGVAVSGLTVGTDYTGVKFILIVIDLTTIFSAAELVTIGSSVATFKSSWLTKRGTPLPQYIPYDAGSLKNVDGEYRLRGRNLWDEEWGNYAFYNFNGARYEHSNSVGSENPIRVFPSTTYYVKIASNSRDNNVAIVQYDANMNLISWTVSYGGDFTMSDNTAFINFYWDTASETGVYANDFCINLSDASFNGTYEKYYNGGAIDCSGKPLNGVGTAQDEKDYATGVRTTRCSGVITLDGDTTIADRGLATGRISFDVSLPMGAYTDGASIPIILSDKLKTISQNASWNPSTSGDYVSRTTADNDTLYLGAVRWAGMTLTQVSADLASNPIHFVYAITPVVSYEPPQDLVTQNGYNILEPVSGSVQSGNISATYPYGIGAAIEEEVVNRSFTRDARNYPENTDYSIQVEDTTGGAVLSTVIKGKTAAVNQLCDNDFVNHYNTTGSATITKSGNTTTINLSGNNSLIYLDSAYRVFAAAGHTVLVLIDKYNITNKGDSVVKFSALTNKTTATTADYNLPDDGVRIFNLSNDAYGFGFYITNTANGNSVSFDGVTLTDLTARGFSASETTDVAKLKSAWLKKYGTPLPKYIPYDNGSLSNVNGTYRMRGRNLWDEEWESGYYKSSDGTKAEDASLIRSKNPIPVDASTTYYIKAPINMSVYGYDTNGNFIGAIGHGLKDTTFTTQANCRYIAFNPSTGPLTTYNHDITLNDNDPSINGQYIPSYNGGSIDCSAKPLNGFNSVQDEKDFATGVRTTRFAQYTFDGTENWEYVSSWTHHGFRLSGEDFTAIVPNGKNGGALFMLGAPYTNIGSVSQWSTIANNDKQVGTANSVGGIAISDDAYSDAATFKAAMVGAVLVYELATPTTSVETPQPVYTEDGYNVFEPVSGGVQSAEVNVTYIKDKEVSTLLTWLTAQLDAIKALIPAEE